VYLQRFPSGLGKVRVSPRSGAEPRWRRDGRELYYLERAGDRQTLMAVPVSAAGAAGIGLGAATPLFEFKAINFVLQANVFLYNPAPDGQRFLVNALVSNAEPTLNVMTNWRAAARSER